MSEKTEEPTLSDNSFRYANSVLLAVEDDEMAHITFTMNDDDTRHVAGRISMTKEKAISILQQIIDKLKY